MKRPITVSELVWKYMSVSQEQKDLFGRDPVVPATDLFNALCLVERSMKINCEMARQSSLLLRFLILNESKLESQEFRVLINDVRLSLDGLTDDAQLLKVEYDALVNIR